MNKKALIVVDYQKDFVEGGNLAVNGGLSLLPKINKLIDLFDLVIYTKDYHPQTHKSFASNHEDKKVFDVIDLNGIQQVLWPDHCVQGTPGCDFVDGLKMHKNCYIFKKGLDSEVDSYSGFYDNAKKNSTGLSEFLKEKEIESVFIVGIAGDYCVMHTAKDAKKEGFEVVMITDVTVCVDENYDIQEECRNNDIHILFSDDTYLIL